MAGVTGGTGVAVPGVAALEGGGSFGASSDIQKTMVSAKLWTRSMGFFASKILRDARLSAMVTDMALWDAMLPPTGTSANTISSISPHARREWLTKGPQALGHQELELLLREYANIFPDPLPVRIRDLDLLGQDFRFGPVVHPVIIFLDIAAHIRQSRRVAALRSPVIWVFGLFLWGVEGSSRNLVDEGWVGTTGLYMRDG